jgi:hypothetical protein
MGTWVALRPDIRLPTDPHCSSGKFSIGTIVFKRVWRAFAKELFVRESPLNGTCRLPERWKVSVNEMIGTTMLLYGLINPVGVVPIYLSLVRRISPDRAHRIIVVSAATVAGLLAAAAGFGREILEFFNVGMDDFRIAGACLR